MTSPIIELISGVVELPVEQRAVLVPLFARAILDEAPEGVELPEDLAKVVDAFFGELGSDPETWNARLDEKLRAAGVTKGLLGELALRMGLKQRDPAWAKLNGDRGSGYQARAEPTEHQARSGPAAQFQLQSLGAFAAPKSRG